jgi:hypothetical protein
MPIAGVRFPRSSSRGVQSSASECIRRLGTAFGFARRSVTRIRFGAERLVWHALTGGQTPDSALSGRARPHATPHERRYGVPPEREPRTLDARGPRPRGVTSPPDCVGSSRVDLDRLSTGYVAAGASVRGRRWRERSLGAPAECRSASRGCPGRACRPRGSNAQWSETAQDATVVNAVRRAEGRLTAIASRMRPSRGDVARKGPRLLLIF